MGRASVEMYPCAFHLGKWEPDESVEDACHRALNVTDDSFATCRGMMAAHFNKGTPTRLIVCMRWPG
jgi:hypothetical protein